MSVTGIAGIGKSRLAWEFYKYIDGLPQTTLWHRGRCLAYGEGVTYWALADMVRMRCRIAEDEAPDVGARQAARDARASTSSTSEERRFVEPRLAHLLGLEERQARAQEDLFGAWRLFFERLADPSPSRSCSRISSGPTRACSTSSSTCSSGRASIALFVLTLARPELAGTAARPGARAAATFNALYLEPLLRAGDAGAARRTRARPARASCSERILARAEGVPLYAVETVRMLLDRGLLVQEGAVYRPTGEIETLEVPETLHALIAARLDGLSPEERRLLQDAAVLGKTFTRQALAALSGLEEAQLEPLLAGLVRKEVLSVQADPRSPERGQYGFLQDLVRRVAYETLSKRERKARHLAAAAQLERAFGSEQEVVEVLASHYLAAYEAAPEDYDARAVQAARRRAARARGRARGRARRQARRHSATSAKRPRSPTSRSSGRVCSNEPARWRSAPATPKRAKPSFEQALALFHDAGERHHGARLTARLGDVAWRRGQLDAALERMERAWIELSGDKPDADVATLAAQIARLHVLKGDWEAASARLDTALELAESLSLPEVLAETLNSMGVVASCRSHLTHAEALVKGRTRPRARARTAGGGATGVQQPRRHAAPTRPLRRSSRHLEQGIAYARRVGDLHGNRRCSVSCRGRWRSPAAGSEALSLLDQVPEERLVRGDARVPGRPVGAARRRRAGWTTPATSYRSTPAPGLDRPPGTDVLRRGCRCGRASRRRQGPRGTRRRAGRCWTSCWRAPPPTRRSSWRFPRRSTRHSRWARWTWPNSCWRGSRDFLQGDSRPASAPTAPASGPASRPRTERPSGQRRALPPPPPPSANTACRSGSRSRSPNTPNGSSALGARMKRNHCLLRHARRSSDSARYRGSPAPRPHKPAHARTERLARLGRSESLRPFRRGQPRESRAVRVSEGTRLE